MTVNHDVTGSSPVRGAIGLARKCESFFLCPRMGYSLRDVCYANGDRFRCAPVKSHSRDVHKSQICSVTPCLVDFASHKPSFRRFLLAHPVRGANEKPRQTAWFFRWLSLYVGLNRVSLLTFQAPARDDYISIRFK